MDAAYTRAQINRWLAMSEKEQQAHLERWKREGK